MTTMHEMHVLTKMSVIADLMPIQKQRMLRLHKTHMTYANTCILVAKEQKRKKHANG